MFFPRADRCEEPWGNAGILYLCSQRLNLGIERCVQSYSRNALPRGPLADLSRQVPRKRGNRTTEIAGGKRGGLNRSMQHQLI
jgi:hypothetical protein